MFVTNKKTKETTMESANFISMAIFLVLPAIIAGVVTCAINEWYIAQAKRDAAWIRRVRLAGRLQSIRAIKEGSEA